MSVAADRLKLVDRPKSTPAPNQRKQITAELKRISAQLQSDRRLQSSLRKVEPQLLDVLKVHRFTIYQNVDNGREMITAYKTGIRSSDADSQSRIAMGPSSIVGFVALSQSPVLVSDIEDEDELVAIHPRLKHLKGAAERSNRDVRSMIAVPIKDQILRGVLQITASSSEPVLNRQHLKQVKLVAAILSKKLSSLVKSTQGPYEQLVSDGKISAEDLAEIEQNAPLYNGSITRILMEDFSIEADDIGRSLESYYNVPYMKYDPTHLLPQTLFENIKTSYLRNNLWLPVDGDKNEAVILISNPADHQKIMAIQGIVNAESYVFRVGIAEHIQQFLREENDDEIEGDFDDVFTRLDEQVVVEVEDDPDASQNDEQSAASSAIIQLVNKIIIESNRLGASDVHIEPGKDRSAGIVRIRVDGVCRELLRVPAEHLVSLMARIKIISKLDIAERRLPQDGACKLKMKGRLIELRVATVPTVFGESAVLRILGSGEALPLENLNLSKPIYDGVVKITSHHHGLFLVTGPTGSGKTTSLHAVLRHMNRPDRKICTAEDPVEITQPGLQQLQVKPKIGLTFATALRAFLRADPDVILIGEMRDNETANVAIEASLTGHMVLSTLHTNSAPETITRLLDLGLDPVNFSDCLLGILAQRLMRTLCENCRESYQPDDKELAHLVESYGGDQFPELSKQLMEAKFNKAVGCEECSDTGYRGRVGVHELLVCTPKIQNLIYGRASLEEIKAQATQDGMRTLKQDAISKILMGLSDYHQLLDVISE